MARETLISLHLQFRVAYGSQRVDYCWFIEQVRNYFIKLIIVATGYSYEPSRQKLTHERNIIDPGYLNIQIYHQRIKSKI